MQSVIFCDAIISCVHKKKASNWFWRLGNIKWIVNKTWNMWRSCCEVVAQIKYLYMPEVKGQPQGKHNVKSMPVRVKPLLHKSITHTWNMITRAHKYASPAPSLPPSLLTPPPQKKKLCKVHKVLFFFLFKTPIRITRVFICSTPKSQRAKKKPSFLLQLQN